MDSKTCSTCGAVKAFDGFHRDKTRKDGLAARCRACQKAYQAARYAANRAKLKAYSATWYAENRERRKAYAAEWRGENREQKSAYGATHYAENPHVYWAAGYRKRARRFGFEPAVEDFSKPDVIARYGDACFYCETGEFEHLDHWVPVKAGGPHTLSNVRPSCAGCNLTKHDKTEAEWLADQASLDDLTPDELDDLIDAEIERWTK